MTTRGQYTLTTVFLIIVLLVSLGFIFTVNTDLLELKSMSGQRITEQNTMQEMPMRLYSCFGRPIDKSAIQSQLPCVGLEEGQGISITLLEEGNCPREPIKSLNYRGYGSVQQMMVSVRNDVNTTCMARLSVYEHAVRVPLIVGATLTPLIIKKGDTTELNATIYWNSSEVTVESVVYNASNESIIVQNATFTPPPNITSFTIDTSALAPGLYHTSLSSTHSHKYYDTWEDSHMFRVVDQNDKPRLIQTRVEPIEGSAYSTHSFNVRLEDYINITNVTIVLSNTTHPLNTISLLEMDMKKRRMSDNLTFSFDFDYRSKLGLPDHNATYIVSIYAENEYGKSKMFFNQTQFKIIGGKTGDLKVGIFAIEGLLQSQYSPSQ
ncbi:MAG: hypothetical protein ACQESG_01035, partial [Nanobdellota archaeon]